MARRTRNEPPCAGVRFEPDFLHRLQRFAERVAAARERREGGITASLAGGGHEFVGYRPYRAGEDLRALDWSLLARTDRPFVRVTRREAGERWLVALDTSGSMGVGPPGKLQRAAEAAAALCVSGLRLAADVSIIAGSNGARPALELSQRSELRGLLAFLESLRAHGEPSLARDALAASARGAARVFVISDLFSFTPADVMPLARAGRELALVQILAPIELHPSFDETVEWWDPENGERLSLALDERTCASYAIELEKRLEAWRAAAAERRVGYACSSSALAFEDTLRRVLRGLR
jgi:uncharacterized protein (DUF58 family)